MGEREIEIIDVSGCPKAEFSERIPGFIITSKFCTCVDSPELINKTETSTRRDLPSDRVIVKSQSRPSASVHSVDLKFRDSDWLSRTCISNVPCRSEETPPSSLVTSQLTSIRPALSGTSSVTTSLLEPGLISVSGPMDRFTPSAEVSSNLTDPVSEP